MAKDEPGVLEYLESEKATHVNAAKAVIEAAQAEFRELTDVERGQVKEHTDEAHALNKKIQAEKDNRALAKSLEALAPHPERIGDPEDEPTRALTIGEAFTASESYKTLKSMGHLDSTKFSTPAIPVGDIGAVAGIVSEDAGSNAEMILPQRIPGFREPVETPLGLTELFSTATVTQGNSVILVRETVTDNAAAVVAEGAEKPPSDIQFDTETVTLEKIATVIKVSTEMLEDVDGIQSYLNSRLGLFVRQAREDLFATQLLAEAANFSSSGEISTGDNAFDAILVGMVDVLRASGLPADGVAMTVLDWATLMATKDGTNGQYFSGGPFQAPGSQLWGRLRIAITERLGDGNMVVGNFGAGGTVWRKRGLTVDATNSNEDDFLKNLTAIRAEERAVLFLHRPQAFSIVSTTS